MSYIPCGCCGGKINRKETEIGKEGKYFITCTCCENVYQVKEKCARTMYAYSIRIPSSQNITVKGFRNISIPQLCYVCKEDECFFCGKKHPSK
jgi:hypothetical protein